MPITLVKDPGKIEEAIEALTKLFPGEKKYPLEPPAKKVLFRRRSSVEGRHVLKCFYEGGAWQLCIKTKGPEGKEVGAIGIDGNDFYLLHSGIIAKKNSFDFLLQEGSPFQHISDERKYIVIGKIDKELFNDLKKFTEFSIKFRSKYPNPEQKKAKLNQRQEQDSDDHTEITDKEINLNTILYGPPGTGKTYHTTSYAIAIIEERPLDEVKVEMKDDEGNIRSRYKIYKDKDQIVFTTFHQSYSYEDFVEGIRPKTDNGNITYDVEPGIFKKICSKAKEHPEKNYVLIIDEINRGNISKIFGELITLIEKDKRLENKEELTVTLPYSRDPFSVPNNLYIIGTMNTADRSLTPMDTALRRRFDFVPIYPDASLLKDKNINVNLEKLLEAINDKIIILLDREHIIGHSYFMEVDSLPSLTNVFTKQILPLLDEYFFEDAENIKKVLGKTLFEKFYKIPNDLSKDDRQDRKPRWIRKTDKELIPDAKDYKSIYTDSDQQTGE
jgi:5-methylcytosine-specific restriction protein B